MEYVVPCISFQTTELNCTLLYWLADGLDWPIPPEAYDTRAHLAREAWGHWLWPYVDCTVIDWILLLLIESQPSLNKLNCLLIERKVNWTVLLIEWIILKKRIQVFYCIDWIVNGFIIPTILNVYVFHTIKCNTRNGVWLKVFIKESESIVNRFQY